MTNRRGSDIPKLVQARRHTRTGVAVATTFVLAGALSAAVPSGASASSARSDAAASVPSGVATSSAKPNGAVRGINRQIHMVGVSHPATLRPAPKGAGRNVHKPLPLLLQHGRPAQTAVAPVAPSAAKPSGAANRAYQVRHNFDGVDAIQNRDTAGFNLEPPDEGLGAGNGYVANFVNVTGRIYHNNGTPAGSPFYLNTFFREPDSSNTSDPRVFYDASTSRWFATILVYNFDNNTGNISESHLDLAVSRHADPTRRWNIYKIDASNPNHAGCPCLADYPILGIDNFNVYISTNEFTGNFQGFNGSQLYAISKSQLVAQQSSVNTVLFQNLAINGAPAYHVQPANTYGSARAEWMMSSLDPNSTSDHRLGVWAVTNRRAVTTGIGSPRLSSTVIRSEGYSFPPIAQTPPGYCSSCGAPTSGLVNTDFDAMQEVQFINGKLVGALNTGVTIAGDTSDRSGIAWFVVRPSLTRGTVGAGTHVARQGYLATQGLYLLYPHINMTPNGAMAVTFSFGGRQTYLTAAYSVAAPGGGFKDIRRAAAGTGPDNGFTGTDQYGPVGRWGDYSNGQIVPGTNRVWLATQYIPNSGTGYSNWGNRIFQLQLS